MTIMKKNEAVCKAVEFPDNRPMIDLCGQLDSNLSLIESSIGVQIFRRGNKLELGQRKTVAWLRNIRRSLLKIR